MKKSSEKGQALIEFIIILPVFLMLILSVIDFANIISKKYTLQNDLDVASGMYKNSQFDSINTYSLKNDIDINYKKQDDLVTFTATKKIKIISPILNMAFGKNYSIVEEKTIYEGLHEQ